MSDDDIDEPGGVGPGPPALHRAVPPRSGPPSRRSLLPAPSEPLLRSRRSWHLLALLSVLIAAGGFFTGIAGEKRAGRKSVPGEISATATAPGYRELRAERRGPNANIYESAFDRLGERLPGLLADVPPQTEAQRASVLASRAERRAYEGAPPTIPHAIQSHSTFECLACHEKGVMIAGKRAPAMSHRRLESCTQCHAAAAGGPPSPEPAPLTSSTFVGALPASTGERAWIGAPPTIPHATSMRSNCGSCHGVAGALGMRSTHPWRESCTQCHAPSAALDQRPPNTNASPSASSLAPNSPPASDRRPHE